MDVENLKCAKIRLESYLQENGYSQGYIKTLTHEVDRLVSNSDFAKAISYEAYYQDHIVSKYKNPTTLAHKRGLLGRIRNLDLHGIMPSKRHPSFLPSQDSPCRLSPFFKDFISICKDEWHRRSLANSTIASRTGMLDKFFSFLASKGFDHFSDVGEQDILSYFFDGTSVIRGYDVVKILRLSILDYGRVSHDESCKRILSYLPRIRKRHGIYPYLTKEERERIDSLLEESGDHGQLSKRDLAMFTLLYYTGIRRGDLANMRLLDIDWYQDQITIMQGKTGHVNTLPLFAVVGNSILDYIENERPKTKNDYLFLSTNKIPDKLSGGSVYDIVEKVYNVAGVRTDGGRKGTHLLRHNLSLSLLNSGASTPMITEILGHASPEAVNAYLESDEVALKGCALSVESYPIGKEVFEACMK